MIVAFLFDSDPPRKRSRNYYHFSRQILFQTQKIQLSERHMKLSVGDVILGSGESSSVRQAIADAIYYNDQWGIIIENRLERVLPRAFVFAMVFENITIPLASGLHDSIKNERTYLGCKSVDFSQPLQLGSFRLIPKFRLKGRMCRAFYSMSLEYGKDENEIVAMQNLGYNDTGWEDTGAHGTIFDDYDNVEHFKQIEAVRRIISAELEGDQDISAEFVMNLEDLNPSLFDALGAAVFALENGRHADHFAQAAIAGRRYLERLADTLYPANAAKVNGRDVSQKAYRNRLWAFLEQHLPSNKSKLTDLGKKVDFLDAKFNSGLHSTIGKDELLYLFRQAAIVTQEILSLDPSGPRKTYYAFQQNMFAFLKEAHADYSGDHSSE